MKFWKLLALLFVTFLLVNKVRARIGEYEFDQDDDYEKGRSLGTASEDTDGDEEAIASSSSNSFKLDGNNDEEHMKNFKKISQDLKVYEDEYSSCIKEIPDEEFTEDKIDECVGKNFIKVVLDIKYETLKVMAQGESNVRLIYMENCFTPAAHLESFTIGCDYMERDTLEMLWNGLDFVELLEINKLKYLEEYGKVDETDFQAVLEHLTAFSKEFFELIDEIDAHKEVTILRLKTLIDDRNKLILEQAKLNPDSPAPLTVQHTIQITEDAETSGYPVDELPGPQFENSSEKAMRAPAMTQNRYSGRRKLVSANRNPQAYSPRGYGQKVPMRVNTYGNPRSTFTKYRPAQGYVSSNPFDARVAARQNNRRIFNTGTNYAGLHGKTSYRKLVSPSVGVKNQAFRASMINRLSPSMRAQSRLPFKNIHTSHFAKHKTV